MRTNTTLLLLLTITAATGCVGPEGGQTPTGEAPLAVDVAENMGRFAFDDAPIFEDGLPAYGNGFITQGYLYPIGFLDGEDGVRPDGTPTFPEAVIGLWTCRGVFVGDGAHTATGPMVITTQTFELFDAPGYDPSQSGRSDLLVTEGMEVLDPTASLVRAVTGGTGAYRSARGEATQQFLGLNRTGGVNLRIELDLD